MIEKYITTLKVSDDTKRKNRKDITAFVKMLTERGRTWPEEGDYTDYQEALRNEGKSENTIKDITSRIERFFAWFKEQSNDVFDIAPIMREKEAKRFSLIFPQSVYEALEWLSKYDNCSVASVIIEACTSYTDARKEDISFITAQMTQLTRSIEQRKRQL